MNHKDVMKILWGVCILFILEKFCKAVFIKLQVYNFINIILFISIIILIFNFYKDKLPLSEKFDYLNLFFCFMVGISLQQKFKFFIFLAILYLFIIYSDISRNKTYSLDLPRVRILAIILAALVSLGSVIILKYTKLSNIVILFLSGLILILNTIFLLVSLKKYKLSEEANE